MSMYYDVAEDISFESKDILETENYFKEQKETDEWTMFDKSAAAMKGLPGAPILAQTELDGVDTDITHMQEAMETTKMLLSYPTKKGVKTAPLADSAWNAVLGRYGVDCTAMNILRDKKNMSILDSEEKAAFFNVVAAKYKDDQAIVLFRDNMVRYMGSKTYAVLPVYDLFESLSEGLAEAYPYYNFVECQSGMEVTRMTFELKSDELIERIKKYIMKYKKGNAEYSPMLQFVTSDIGLRSATLYPYIKSGNSEVLLGSSINLVHDSGNTPDMFKGLVPLIMSLFNDSADKFEKYSSIQIENVRGCFVNLAKTIVANSVLQKKSVLSFADEVVSEYPSGCTALDLYFKLSDCVVYDEATRKNKYSMNEKLTIQEMLARILNLQNIKDFDHETTQW